MLFCVAVHTVLNTTFVFGIHVHVPVHLFLARNFRAEKRSGTNSHQKKAAVEASLLFCFHVYQHVLC